MTIERNMVFAAAAAIGLLGVLNPLAPAHADPIPVPPNCNGQFIFSTVDLDLTQDDGTDVFPPTAQHGTTISGQSYYLAGPARKKTTGNFVGGMNGNTISFTANWDTGGWNKYTGTINADSSMSGVTLSNTGASEHWSSGKGSVACARPAVVNPVNPVNPVDPVNPVNPVPPAGHTITGPVDLYDVPGGNGRVIGQLQTGDAVTENGPCPIQSADATNGWCVVTDTTQGVSGAVWGDFVSH